MVTGGLVVGSDPSWEGGYVADGFWAGVQPLPRDEDGSEEDRSHLTAVLIHHLFIHHSLTHLSTQQ
jgi:hypothetical protein